MQVSPSWGGRLGPELHPYLDQQRVALALVARIAGGDRVGPRVLAPSGGRHDVVDGVAVRRAAVATYPSVAAEHAGPGPGRAGRVAPLRDDVPDESHGRREAAKG